MNFSVEILRSSPFIGSFGQYFQVNQLYFSGCNLDNLELEFSYFDNLIQLREATIGIQYQPTKRHVLLAFGQI